MGSGREDDWKDTFKHCGSLVLKGWDAGDYKPRNIRAIANKKAR